LSLWITKPCVVLKNLGSLCRHHDAREKHPPEGPTCVRY
jgi:hypothetical protein